MTQVWTVRLGQQAEKDYLEILHWTSKTFGEKQARIYAETLALAIESLSRGPEILGAKARDDIQTGLWSLHVARQGRAGRHFLVFRLVGLTVDVLRLLHDSMDLPRHLPLDTGPSQ